VKATMKMKAASWLGWACTQTALFGPLAIFGKRNKPNMARYRKWQHSDADEFLFRLGSGGGKHRDYSWKKDR